MNQFAGLAEAFGSKGFAASGHRDRTVLATSEYGEVELPPEMLRQDGSLDIYDDVQSFIEVHYKRKRHRLVIRSNGWVGHIPLNDSYVLEVETRVPVGNLERLVSRAPGTKIELLQRYTHRYLAAQDRPKSLFDILIDRFLFTIEEIRRDGLLKEYVRRERTSYSPAGRLDPRRTKLLTQLARSPVAACSAFERTPDIGPNRLVRLAIDKAITYYLGIASDERGERYERLLTAAGHFDNVGSASADEISPEAIARYARHLPEHRTAYVDALRLAGYIVADLGLAVRGSGGIVIAPAAVIDMAAVFESYARNLLAQMSSDQQTRVLDGNIGGGDGAKQSLFTHLVRGGASPTVQPDIVIARGGKPQIIIDVKYKPPDLLPDRSETNQMACYAARYGCNTVMVLYPQFPKAIKQPVELVGEITDLKLYRGVLDIGASNLAEAEVAFCDAVNDLVRRTAS